MVRVWTLLGVIAVLWLTAPDVRAQQDDGQAAAAEQGAEPAPTEGSAPASTDPDASAAETSQETPDAALAEPLPVIPVADPSAPTSGTLTETGEPVLDDVVVTASRRQQKIGTVPIAVFEISGEELNNNVIRDTQSLVMQVPSLNIQFSGSEANATIRIRGIGTGGGNAGFESSVGVFVDGVYLPRPGLALTDLVDIDRIEVLRGPQGTLFGKNTTVGAIHLMTRAPTFTPEADLRIGGGSFSNRIFSAIVGGPLVDDWLAVRLSGQYNRRDGYVTNVFNGEKYNDRDRYVVRAQALLTPTDYLSLRLIGTRNSKTERCCVAPFTAYNAAAAESIRDHGGTVFDPPAEYQVAFDYTDTFSNAGEDSYSAHLDWDLGGVTATGIVSYGKGFADDKRDGDFTDVDYAYQPFVNAQTKITTAEVSLHGNWGILDWLGGVFYSDETIGARAQTLIGEDAGSMLIGNGVPPGTQLPLYPAGTGNISTAYQDDTSVSIFTHNVFQLGWGFDATVGLRYLEEKKVGGGEAVSDSPSCALPLIPGGTLPTVPAGGIGDPSRTTNGLRVLCGADPYNEIYEDDRITGTAALGKLFDSGVYVYASYSDGFKAGGINLNPVSTVGGTFQFKPEQIRNYEAGLRFGLFGGALRSRATYFFMDLRDYQVNAFDGTAFTVSNAGHVEASGVEFESSLRIGAGLSFKGNFTYTEALYAEGTANIGAANSSVIGKPVTNSPEWVGQLSANYISPPFWGITFFSTLAARYQSLVNTGVDLNPAKEQAAYTLLNGRVGLNLPGDFELSASGTNLTDTYYRQIIFDAVVRPPLGAAAEPRSYNGYPGTPRTILVELRKTF